ncbi:MAG TPA: hypothetical protein DCP08_02700 [Chloroflexi bacterium]|nr:hypothetical protein [Chloroflexota bacterium]
MEKREALGKHRVIVLGLDGATFDLLMPLIRRGELPNLARLIEGGVHGVLESILPPYTAPAWASFATGKNPGKHGVVDFWEGPSQKRRRTPVSSRSIRGETLWSILSEEGRKVAVINLPLTYPPSPVNGVLISGMMTPCEEADYTFPKSLKGELKAQVGEYAVNPYARFGRNAHSLKKAIYWIEKREEANRYLFEKRRWDLFINVIQAPDPIQHHFWHLLDPYHGNYNEAEAKKYENLILECYKEVDCVVGQRLQKLDDETTLFVISDHGFGPAHKYFHVNRFLADLGLLAFQSPRGALHQGTRKVLGRGADLWRSLLRAVDLFDLRIKVLDNRVRAAIRERLDGTFSPPIDWAKTKAYCQDLAGQSIYINLRESGEEYEEIRDYIIGQLMKLKDPETQEPIIAHAYKKEELYQGEYLDSLPDILFSLGPHPYLPTSRLSVSSVVEGIPPYAVSGMHREQGLFVAFGSKVQKGMAIAGAKIVDLAPTILYAMKVAIPEGMDGKVLLDIFQPSYVASTPIRYQKPSPMEAPPYRYTEEEREEIEARLRSLGYLD